MAIRKTWLAASVSASLFSLAAQAADETGQTAASSETQPLQNITVSASKLNGNKDSYTVSEMSTATGLKLAPKDTPQSVSVITRRQLDDLGVTSLDEALKTTTGINVVRRGNYMQYQSRGFNISSITTNGINSTIASVQGNNLHNGKQLADTALFERIEVLRGASGLKQTASEPGGSINAVL